MKRETAEKARELLNEIEGCERVLDTAIDLHHMDEIELSRYNKTSEELDCALEELENLKDE